MKPSLFAAGLTELADYDGAVADVQRQKAEAQRLRQQADQDDRDAGEAERSAAPLESRRLLLEIENVEAERATHLGQALAVLITKAFLALTGGRYGPISLDPGLKTLDIEVRGAARRLDHLSVVTREQLATLLRLAVAGSLKTAIVLDDQLVHSDTERLAWFSDRLRASATEHDHQVIVFTCRPGDHFSRDASDSGATAVDLAALVSR